MPLALLNAVRTGKGPQVLDQLNAALLTRPADDLDHRLRWSLWRRRQQARARTCHYRRQSTQP